MAADAVMPISVVIERRGTGNRWLPDLWRPLGVLPRTDAERGSQLAAGDGWAHYHGGTLEIELYSGETEGYLTNLSQDPPVVFVVLRRSDEPGVLEFEPFLATVCPYEAMGYTQDSDDIVEGVPMPPEIVTWLQEFVTRHHVEVPFQKRKNKRHHDDYGGRQPRDARARGVL